ncbi:hypothetical protein [Desulfitobacterium sp.]|uniref:hypothetical protein n=1 Tax=Desulfitobacterium sp. TaxID=49981 RepID=UPI002B5AC941|nr:hypothetical protein [Desulfitobacterium sp.]HVJ48583.1 hypothetical protein [Desulfitobacterium sp.]
MQYNEAELKTILDEGMVTRSLIETETAMKKCHLYNEMATDPAIKSFFKEQAKGLEDVMNIFKNSMADLK